MNRREFLELGSQSVAALALTCPLSAVLCACGQTPLAPGGPPAPTVTLLNNSAGTYVLNFSNYPALQSPGGSIHAIIQAKSGDKDVFVTRVSTHSAVTVSSTCTHAGCTINPYDSTKQSYLCPCHNSIFNSDGSVKQGPAATPLPTYPTTITSSGIQVTVA